MTDFTPCRGKTACRDDDVTCLTCGRGLDEIARTRDLIDALAALAIERGYGNVEEFAGYVADKVVRKVHARRAR
jgi:hypothetical protein